jgi:hypothetical protein
VTVNGKKLGGLVNRRKLELAMFNGNVQDPLSLKNWAFFGSLKAIVGRA